MSTIHLHRTTRLTPEQYVAGLTDFGPGRSKLFGNSADEYLKVHHHGRTTADVTEGSGGVWERLHYDWSDPNRAVLVTTDSNVWGGASGHTYTFTRRIDGATDIDVVVVRQGKNLKGHLLGFVLGTIGKRVLSTAFENSVKAIEERDHADRLLDRAHSNLDAQGIAVASTHHDAEANGWKGRANELEGAMSKKDAIIAAQAAELEAATVVLRENGLAQNLGI